ncbi:MAG TPA: AI-2E family transporter [Prolixibacteraceae bacterium]|nr:AI-2E family transporter [Prolixibacteraceae bacterium]
MDENNKMQTPSPNYSVFLNKVWITVGIVALTVVVLWIMKAIFSVLLLVLAGVLIALFFRGLSGIIQRKTHWKEGVSLAISMIGILLLLAGMFWLIGAKVQQQAVELMETLPSTIESAKEKVSQSEVGQKVMEKMSSKKSMDKAQGLAGKFFSTTFGVFGDIYVILFIAIFFTISPSPYVEGMIALVPPKGRKKARDVLDKIADHLKGWLKGILFAMFVVFVLTAIGLGIMGMKLWLVLSLLAGLISFIPNFGPLIALIPALLVAMLEGPQMALMVAGLYLLVQVVESNFITPMVQQKLIDLPPALIILTQVVMGVLIGGWGLVLATPLTVIVIVLIQELYVKRENGETGDS